MTGSLDFWGVLVPIFLLDIFPGTVVTVENMRGDMTTGLVDLTLKHARQVVSSRRHDDIDRWLVAGANDSVC
jgi:hypothetical protein